MDGCLRILNTFLFLEDKIIINGKEGNQYAEKCN